MPDKDEIESVLRNVCGASALDEDTFAYVASVIEDEAVDDPKALFDNIGDYLESNGVVDDEKAGLVLCETLFKQLYPEKAEALASKAKAGPKSKAKGKAKGATAKGGGYPSGGSGEEMSKPIVLSSLLAEEKASGAGFADIYQTGPKEGKDARQKGHNDVIMEDNIKVVAQVSKAKKEKQQRRAEKKAWRADEKTEDGGVWVDLPSGCSIGTGASVAIDFHLEKANLVNKKGVGELLVDAQATFASGRRYGLIGRNGVGKSTFLDAVARREFPSVPKCSIFYVRQEVEGDSRTPMEWVLQSNSEKMNLQAEKEKLEANSSSATAGRRLTEIYERLEEISRDSHNDEQKATNILKGLGFDEVLKEKPVAELSGGMRMRVAIACALFVSPGLLLLDEPTNHLDLETVVWLEKYIMEEFQQTMLVVSHDRKFLNQVVTDVCLFENAKLELYRGDYSSFEAVRQEHRQRQERLRESQEQKREHLQEFIRKHAEFGHNGCKEAAMRKARMRKLERLGMEAQAHVDGRKLKVSYDGVQDDIEEVQAISTVTLDFPDPGICDSLGNPLIRLDDVSFAYDKQPSLFSGCTLGIDQKSRLALLGRNGTGKSTLIKILLDRLNPRSGTRRQHTGAVIEYIAQHHMDELDGEISALQYTLERFPGDGTNQHELNIRKFLGRFGCTGDTMQNQKIKTLSGGQKFRVSLALAMYRKPHLLVMDEPTNHLDMETIDAMVKAIDEFQGGIVIVSHDQHLIGSVCKELYVLANKKVARYHGTIEDYRKMVVSGKV